MFCSSKPNDYGLSGNHAFQLRKMETITFKGKSLNLMQLRNPWGHDGYKGAWKPDSSNWTDAIKAAVKYEEC